MAKLVSILIGVFMLAFIPVSAQQTVSRAMYYPYHMFGAEARADVRSGMEFTYRYLGEDARSFGIKISRSEYWEDLPTFRISTRIPTISATHNYFVEGVSLKLGWIAGSRIWKRGMISSGIYLACSRNHHVYNQIFSDANGSVIDSYSRFHYTLGAEFEFLMGLRLYDNFIITGAFQIGGKTPTQFLFNDVVKELPSYKNYVPGQGFGISPLYINGSLGLCFMF